MTAAGETPHRASDRLAAQAAIAARYPRTAVLRDEHRVSLRPMTPADRGAVLAFARALPPDDLLFLASNITEEEALDDWLNRIAAGRTFTILAVDEGSVGGYVSLAHHTADWTRHLGEIRLVIAPALRGQGLGRVLATEMYSAAIGLGLRKLSAQMTPDQAGARTTFEHLGFRVEARLRDYVVDAAGTTRDLLVMTYDLRNVASPE